MHKFGRKYAFILFTTTILWIRQNHPWSCVGETVQHKDEEAHVDWKPPSYLRSASPRPLLFTELHRRRRRWWLLAGDGWQRSAPATAGVGVELKMASPLLMSEGSATFTPSPRGAAVSRSACHKLCTRVPVTGSEHQRKTKKHMYI